MDNHIFFDMLLPNQENIYAIKSTSYYTYKLQGKYTDLWLNWEKESHVIKLRKRDPALCLSFII